jgi:TatD DNase family protein
MIDSHAHLIWESFDEDRDAMMNRAEEAGVKAFIHPCVHTADLPKMQAIQAKYPNVFLSAGVHPCDAIKWTDQCDLDIVNFTGKLFAIGETGLDFYHTDSPKDIQEEVFRKQCRLAKKLNLPLIVHCRDAFEDTLRVLREENVGKGVMHCYTGDAEYSAKFWELGFYTSFSGCLTFKSAQPLRDAAQKIPLERTLIETDCPFLAPQKYRGKRNEPSFVKEVCESLATIHEKSFSEIDEITSTNAIKLFSLEAV